MKLLANTVILVLFSAFIFCEDQANGFPFQYNGSVFQDMNFYSFHSPMNPGNVLNVKDGLSGTFKYVFDIKMKGNDLTFKASDFGYLKADNGAALTNKVSELYFSFHLFGQFLDLGKKKITHSVSFVKSPLDFIMISSGDVSQNRSYNLQFTEGKIMINTDLYSDFGVFGLSYMPKIDFTNDAAAYFSQSQKEQREARYSVNFSGVDINAAVSYEDIWKAGCSLSGTIGDYFEAHAEGAYIERKERLRLDTNSVITGYNPMTAKYIYSDIMHTDTITNTNTMELVIGGSYNGENFSCIAEYYFNQNGYDSEEWKQIRNTAKDTRAGYDNHKNEAYRTGNLGAIQSMIGNSGFMNLCQNYGMIRISNPSSEKFGLTGTTILNLQDWSGMEMFSLEYSGWENAVLSFSSSLSFGEEYSEFRMLGQDWAISTGLKIGF